MRKYLLTTILMTVMVLCGGVAKAQNYVVVDSEKIFKSIESYNTAVKEIESRGEAYQKQIDEAFDQLEQEYNTYQNAKAGYTATQRQNAERKILNREQEITKFQEQVFGDEGTLMKLREEKLKPIQDRVFKVIDEYAVKNGYGLVLDVASNPTVLYYSPAMDKTQEIIKIVNNN